MRLVCISDTHTMHDQVVVPTGDVLIHAGDWSGHGSGDELLRFARWLKRQPHEHKLVIAGNHDWSAVRNEEGAVRSVFASAGAIYLRDSEVVIDGLKFYGSPWQPEFCQWAFNLPRGGDELRERWAAIPADTAVLITHGPPHGILDHCPTPQGCERLTEWLEMQTPLVHVFGHIHEGAGAYKGHRTLFVNASTCTATYQPNNPPIVVDIEREKMLPHGFAYGTRVAIDKKHLRDV